MEQSLIAARGISLAFGNKSVLDGVSLAVNAGEIVTVIGPNGAGKSSLIKVMLGLQKPSAGQVVRKDNLRLGYVPQKFPTATPLPLSVRRLMSLTQRVDDGAIVKCLDETGAAHLIDDAVSELSGGEMQRVLLARALLREPELLVLDEPAQSVDFNGEIKLYQLIASLRRSHGLGILMVSHDLHMVMAESDRVICLNGHICCQGKPSALKQDQAFLALFGPKAGDAMATYAHRHDHDHEGHSHDHHHHHGARK